MESCQFATILQATVFWPAHLLVFPSRGQEDLDLFYQKLEASGDHIFAQDLGWVKLLYYCIKVRMFFRGLQRSEWFWHMVLDH